ncbi:MULTISPECIES: hypothetical protein [unclassified Pseudomonas]|uniref:hypothetical protein n=1 Tax=unclassified Pseudomonas TaxID=196821 RepID=UPI000A1FA19D|nr:MULTISPECIES: hypothetical protein [unclassified Pseudomonas]
MPVSKEEIVEAVSAMSEVELKEMVKAFEEKFGVSAAFAAPANPLPDQSSPLTDALNNIVTLAKNNEKDSAP